MGLRHLQNLCNTRPCFVYGRLKLGFRTRAIDELELEVSDMCCCLAGLRIGILHDVGVILGSMEILSACVEILDCYSDGDEIWLSQYNYCLVSKRSMPCYRFEAWR